MLEVIRMYILPCLINVITVIYLTKKLIVSNDNFLQFKKICLIIIWVIITILNYMYIVKFVRFIFSTFLNIIFGYFIFNNKKRFIVPTIVVEQLLLFISEFIFYLILYYFKVDVDQLFSKSFGILFGNSTICFFALILINNDVINKLCGKIIKYIIKINEYNKYLILLVLFFTINILLYFIYNNSLDNFVIYINSFFIIIYSYIVFQLFNEKNKNYIFKEQNRTLVENLNEYEKMLDYQRVNNHENKNQLLVIKAMVEKEDKKTIEYINEIIKEKREDNELMYTKAKRIPSGGLQGLVYQKMLAMQENYINVILDVSSNVRKIDFSILSSKMNYDICRIMGIILDNAIEETIKFNRKEREIVISMYIDELFVIEVSNRIKDNIELDKIYDKGYTSKEKGHGYGLSLLKKIIDKNDNVINELKITNDIFTQIIKIKM